MVPVEPERVERCEDCKYWDRRVDGTDGDCKCEPPVPIAVPMQVSMGGRSQMGVMSYFPTTRPDIWCGRFIPMIRLTH